MKKHGSGNKTEIQTDNHHDLDPDATHAPDVVTITTDPCVLSLKARLRPDQIKNTRLFLVHGDDGKTRLAHAHFRPFFTVTCIRLRTYVCVCHLCTHVQTRRLEGTSPKYTRRVCLRRQLFRAFLYGLSLFSVSYKFHIINTCYQWGAAGQDKNIPVSPTKLNFQNGSVISDISSR